MENKLDKNDLEAIVNDYLATNDLISIKKALFAINKAYPMTKGYKTQLTRLLKITH